MQSETDFMLCPVDLFISLGCYLEFATWNLLPGICCPEFVAQNLSPRAMSGDRRA
ncbi:hypothetical protein [Thermoleptolyngbya sp. M55_K2018_002]|uniref:hypothetical protein n=1 Tax=Thermoleptolyngbya sp. M55_K2018_002 TaxID=2747808 RepID=UPI0019E921F4|nr:hypothetical protein [Thermoleptolyngbya sp. M55_K2018_002]HIK40449.1 hypothetical protein [Thermoleptolyngbya sp. M55_K2018_002]